MSTPEATAKQVQKWIWILVYAGMVLLALGLSVSRTDTVLGWGIAGPGIASIGIGMLLIWVRSRMKLSKETR